MTQNQILIQHLLKGHGITQLEASWKYGIGRLASRISELKDMGIKPERRLVNVRKATGKAAWVAEYYLRKECLTDVDFINYAVSLCKIKKK